MRERKRGRRGGVLPRDGAHVLLLHSLSFYSSLFLHLWLSLSLPLSLSLRPFLPPSLSPLPSLHLSIHPSFSRFHPLLSLSLPCPLSPSLSSSLSLPLLPPPPLFLSLVVLLAAPLHLSRRWPVALGAVKARCEAPKHPPKPLKCPACRLNQKKTNLPTHM